VGSFFSGLSKIEDPIIVKVNGKIYDSWSEVEIVRSIENVSSGFKISMADKWRESEETWPLQPGKQLRVSVGDIPVINGYIDRLDVSISGGDRKLEVTGRDKTADIVDASAIGTATLKDVSIKDIAEHFATELFGVKVTVNTDIGDNFKIWTIKQGETVFETLQRAARLRGVLLQSDTDGNLVITNRSDGTEAQPPSTKNLLDSFDFVAHLAAKAGTSSSEVSLIQGKNVLAASASFDQTERFSDYLIKGQAPGKDNFNGLKVTQVKATAKDIGMNRFRPLTVIAEGNIDTNAAKRRANWEASTRAAKSTDVQITVQGWLQTPGGKLWEPNNLVTVDVPFIGVKSIMLIAEVTYKKGSDGTFTDISLTRADAFKPDLDVIKKNKSTDDGLGWLRKAVDRG